jgi:hypothetical protein
MKSVYEDNRIVLEVNTGGEYFLRSKASGTVIRIHARMDETIVTCHQGRLTPWSVNGLPAFLVSPTS